MRWITRKDIKVDRVACPWLIKRFVDPQAEFLFVEEKDLLEQAKQQDAIPYDAPKIEAVKLNHRGPRCTFEAIVEDYNLGDPAVSRLALIVRAADVKGQESVAAEGIGLALSSNLTVLLIVAFIGMLNGTGTDRSAAFALDQAVVPGLVSDVTRTWNLAWYNVLLDGGGSLGALGAALPILLQHHIAFS